MVGKNVSTGLKSKGLYDLDVDYPSYHGGWGVEYLSGSESVADGAFKNGRSHGQPISWRLIGHCFTA